jgi:hypothetical protein
VVKVKTMADGLAGAQLLSWQLATYRMLDGFAAARANNEADTEISRLCALNDLLVGRVNHAVQAHNLLLNQAQAYEAECKRRFTQLEARIDQLERQNAELTAAKEKAEAEVIEYAIANVRRILSDPA